MPYHHYHIYFRLRRGGIGIPYDLARTELMSVFATSNLQITHEHIPKHQMWVTLDLPPDEIPKFAHNLAYTEAILSQHIEPYRDQKIEPIERGRWYTGWIRQGDNRIFQKEVFVQDIVHRRHESPDQHTFPIIKNGQIITAKGHHARRALSAMDARFLFNIANPSPQSQILDPFAGFGSIVREAHRRNLTIHTTDIDPALALGLHQLTSCYVLSDARRLPYQSHSFNAIITEPPFHPKFHHALNEALPELCRVLQPQGKLILLIAQNMLNTLHIQCQHMNLSCQHIATIPRDHGLQCPVLLIQSLT